MSDKPSGFVLDGINVIAEIKDGQVANYVRGANGIIYRKAPDGTKTYYITNNHGDVTELLDSEYNVIQSYVYDEYGNVTSSTGTDTNPFKYCGEYYDEESGLIYLRARYYSPELGRFISEDPIRDDLNWYVYCGSNPINFLDPLGLEDVLLRYAIEKNGGTVSWDETTNTATVSLNGKQITYRSDITNNDRMYLDSAILAIDFQVDESLFVTNVGDKYASADDAALSWHLKYNKGPDTSTVEFGSWIYHNEYDGTYEFGDVIYAESGAIPGGVWDDNQDLGKVRFGRIHYHDVKDDKLDWEDYFSEDDMDIAFHDVFYLSSPFGSLKRMDQLSNFKSAFDNAIRIETGPNMRDIITDENEFVHILMQRSIW